MADRPRIVTYNSASVDGRITLAPGSLLLFGDQRWEEIAGNDDSYERLQTMFHPGAILEGSGSFVVEGDSSAPPPVVKEHTLELTRDFLPGEVVQRPGHAGWFTVVDSRGQIRWAFKEWPDEAWRGWHLLVLVARSTPASYLAYLQAEMIPYLVVGKDRVDLSEAVGRLSSALGVDTLVSTAGGQLNGALLRAGLVDEVVVEFLPAIIGGRGTPSLFDAPPLEATESPTRLRLISAQIWGDGRLWTHYAVRDV